MIFLIKYNEHVTTNRFQITEGASRYGETDGRNEHPVPAGLKYAENPQAAIALIRDFYREIGITVKPDELNDALNQLDLVKFRNTGEISVEEMLRLDPSFENVTLRNARKFFRELSPLVKEKESFVLAKQATVTLLAKFFTTKEFHDHLRWTKDELNFRVDQLPDAQAEPGVFFGSIVDLAFATGSLGTLMGICKEKRPNRANEVDQLARQHPILLETK